jgi:hypothetical protein
VPKKDYAETMNKATGLLRALEKTAKCPGHVRFAWFR